MCSYTIKAVGSNTIAIKPKWRSTLPVNMKTQSGIFRHNQYKVKQRFDLNIVYVCDHYEIYNSIKQGCKVRHCEQVMIFDMVDNDNGMPNRIKGFIHK